MVDWKFANLAVGESYCPIAAKITSDALQLCVEHLHNIKIADEEGMAILIEALIQSGLAMLLMGQSYSASGGEHHLSHYWEMDFLQKKKPQVLHGAKVGVACTMIADLYQTEAMAVMQNEAQLTNLLLNHDAVSPILQHRDEIQELIASIPTSAALKSLLQQLDGPTKAEELGVADEVVEKSLQKAHLIRKNRFTLLYFLNEVIG